MEEIEDQLIEKLVSFKHRPYDFVIWAFPWGEPGELEKHPDGPDEWQADVLKAVQNKLITPYEAINIAASSGHGVGKSCLTAWLVLWAISTMIDTRGVVTANTDTQLRTKTWPEVAKWHRLFIAKEWFKLTATAIYSADPEHERTWRIDIIPWSVHNTEAFAGLHNQGKRIIVVFDEASAIDDRIWEVAEGAMTDEETEIFWFAFGNPTRNSGRFRECWKKFKHRWMRWQIDGRKSRLTNKKKIQKWIEDYGIDSDFVKIRVLGEFPSSSSRQFIPTEYVDEARRRTVLERDVAWAPRILGVDPAWTGEDKFVIWFRQGNFAKRVAQFEKNDDDFEMAGHIARLEDTYEADAVFIDFGYGTGIFSAGKTLKRKWILVPFGGAPSSKMDCLNKRTEMWDDVKDWLRDGGSIPDDPEIADQLTGPEIIPIKHGKNIGKKKLESKEDMRDRGLPSPNDIDALGLTFAHPVQRKDGRRGGGKKEFSGKDYDPFKGM